MPRGPFVPIPGTAKVELIGHDIGDNRPAVVVMHCVDSLTPTIAELNNYATAFENFLVAMSAHTNGEITWDLIRVTDLNTATGPQATLASSAGGSGGDAPPGLSAVFFEHTVLRGRSHTGRHFWPVNFGAVDVASGTLSAPEIAAIEVQYTALNTALGALAPTSSTVVASRKLRLSFPVVSITVRPEIGRIRRRAFG